jgi:hypothetical protein
MYVTSCIFHEGQHVYSGPDCPHNREEDEEGPVKEPGWTVQQNR